MYPVKIALYERGEGYSVTMGEFVTNEGVKPPTFVWRILLWVGISGIIHPGENSAPMETTVI